MRLVFAIFDTLNRRSLECYGGTTVRTPNFNRLSERSITFDNHYVGSLPCMPARREMLTGRYNFLHRSWGPCEPFDQTFPDILHKELGTYSHLITDHAHYFKDGGATYHSRYDSFEFIRGQEMDAWKGFVDPPFNQWENEYHSSQFDKTPRSKFRRNLVNRHFINNYEEYPAVQTITAGIEFLRLNENADNWILQLETFDPHEPFDVPKEFRDGYPSGYSGPILDFPPYGTFEGTNSEIEELKAGYCATLSHCDLQLGRILDIFDELNLWQNTALIVTTDHGFLLGEHDLWSKNVMPAYNEVAHIPLFIFLPDFKNLNGARRSALTQTTDLMPTILDLFGVIPPDEVRGVSLIPLFTPNSRGHASILYGQHGSAINITDGRYTYFRFPDNVFDGNLYQYTLMPTHIASMFSVEELKKATLVEPFDFTLGTPVLRVPSTPLSPYFNRHGPGSLIDTKTRLFDLTVDPNQTTNTELIGVERRLVKEMIKHMQANDAPSELYERFKLI